MEEINYYRVDKQTTIYTGTNIQDISAQNALARTIALDEWNPEDQIVNYKVWSPTELMLEMEDGDILFERKKGE